MSGVEALRRDYRTAFLRYLGRGEETALAVGYELGRGALAAGVSILDVARIHHDILVEVLSDTRPEEVVDVAAVASSFFLEVLAASDLAQRAFLSEPPEAP